jgi:general secretion pathway protein D
MPLRFRRHVLLLTLPAFLGACAHPAFRDGLRALSEGRTTDGITSLEKAVHDEPRNPEMKTELIRQRETAIAAALDEAGRHRAAEQPAEAEAAYRRALVLEPANTRARQGLEQIVVDRRHAGMLQQAEQLLGKGDLLGAERLVRIVRAQDPRHGTARRLQGAIDAHRAAEENPPASQAIRAALAKPVVLEFRDASLKSVFEVLSRSSGLNFVFDKDVKGDTKVTLFVRNSPLEDILQLILSTNQLARRQLNDNSFLIYPATAAKAKEYQELVVRSFYLTNTDVKQAQSLVKTVAKSKDVFADEKLNLLIVKDTPDAIRLVERLIDSLDLAEPEVMLEVEVLEITRSRLNEFGVDWPDSIGLGRLTTDTTTTTTSAGTTVAAGTTFGGTLTAGYVNAEKLRDLTTFVANPAFQLNIKGQNADTNVLANPRIRVKNREKAKIHIGDKLPVFTTTSTANVGVSANVTYLDVGLKLEVEPNVTLDDEVSIKVALEVSSISREIAGPSSSLAYQVGTRSANTSLRLRNGETQVLAGLISDEERKSTSHVPGLGEIPLIGRAFGSHRDTSVKTEIVLLITPRIVRNIHRPEMSQPALASGTEMAVGASPLSVRTPGPKSLALASRGGAGRVPAAAEEAVPAAVPVAAAAGGAAVPVVQLAAPGEVAAGAEVDIGVAVPGLSGPILVELVYDTQLLEAVQPPSSSAGRVIVRVDQGQTVLRMKARPGSSGDTNIDVVGAMVDGGEALAGATASRPLRIVGP